MAPEAFFFPFLSLRSGATLFNDVILDANLGNSRRCSTSWTTPSRLNHLFIGHLRAIPKPFRQALPLEPRERLENT